MAITFLGSFFNPLAYVGQHVSITKAADQYRDNNLPSSGIDLNSVTEVSFKEDRQRYITQCAGALKARDFTYSKANATTACARIFDQDGINQDVKNAIAERAAQEKADIKASTERNSKVIIGLIGAFLLTAILLYLFLS